MLCSWCYRSCVTVLLLFLDDFTIVIAFGADALVLSFFDFFGISGCTSLSLFLYNIICCDDIVIFLLPLLFSLLMLLLLLVLFVVLVYLTITTDFAVYFRATVRIF